MRVYLDASVLVALLTSDALTARAETYLRTTAPVLVVSDFACAEFASAIAREVRTREITAQEAWAAFAFLDTWIAETTERAETTTADVRAAEALVRRLDLKLRTPDALHIALHIALAQRTQAALATFDGGMAAAARTLGMVLAAL